jgi:hypothetical protein
MLKNTNTTQRLHSTAIPRPTVCVCLQVYKALYSSDHGQCCERGVCCAPCCRHHEHNSAGTGRLAVAVYPGGHPLCDAGCCNAGEAQHACQLLRCIHSNSRSCITVSARFIQCDAAAQQVSECDVTLISPACCYQQKQWVLSGTFGERSALCSLAINSGIR